MDIMNIFKESLLSENASINTVVAYTRAVKEMEEIVGKELLDVTFMDLKIKWLPKLKESNANRTINQKIAGVKKLYNTLEDFDILEEVGKKNPSRKLESFKDNSNYQRNVWTKEELEKVIECAKNPRDKAVIAFIFNTGCRVEECLTLKLEDYLEGNIRLKVKGDKYRDVVLSNRTKEIINYYIENARKECIEDENYLFVSNTHKKLRRDNVNGSMKKAVKQAGFEDRDISSHNIRSMFITSVANEYGIETASKLVGHADIATTMIYFNEDKKLNKEIMANF